MVVMVIRDKALCNALGAEDGRGAAFEVGADMCDWLFFVFLAWEGFELG
jgi:hypothetical protein